MGRDWSWLGGGGGGAKKKSSKKDIKTPPPPAENTATAAAGCMSAVFKIFDSHHLQFPLNQHHLHLPKGVEASRNSLESTATAAEEDTPFSPSRKDGNLNISIGIKIKTKPQARPTTTGIESDSPSIKTPTLVARLMGLDLVPPDNYISSSPSSTRSSHTNKHTLQRNSIDGGTRSLPETPRVSLGRRSLDVNCYDHQRSSLHLRDNNNYNNKVLFERGSGNNNVRFTRVKEMNIHEDKENRSPREYARQIVMQLKENVSRRRRMGTDITNIRSNKEQQQLRETHESKKASKITIITHDSSEPSSSQISNVAKSPTMQEEPQRTEQEHQRRDEKSKQRKSPKRSKKKTESFKSEEPFVRSLTTCNNNNNNKNDLIKKRTPLSINNLINFTSVPSLHNIKKNVSPLSSPTKSLRETEQPRNRETESLHFPSQSQAISGSELEYITRTLRRSGIDRDTPISYAKWFSPSHPLDPSIFYFLEHFSSENLSLRCERKLLFHLVDEILADFLKTHMNFKPWVCRFPMIRSRRDLKGSELIDEIRRKIEGFPLAECVVLEDIDDLVAGDFPKTAAIQSELEFEEEGEGIVTELERGILETLVVETTADCYATWIKTAPLQSLTMMSVARGEFT